MASSDNQDLLARSIRVVGLPTGFNPDDVLNNLKNAGNIENIKLGTTEMIVTYSSSDEKDLSKMYDGCSTADYTIKLEDPTTLEVSNSQNQAPEQPKPVEVPAEQQHQQAEEPKYEPQQAVSQPEPVARQNHEPQQQESAEKSKPVEPEVSYQERQEPREAERRSEAPPSQSERRPEVPQSQPERRSEAVRGHQEAGSSKSSDSSKDLLRDLQNTNLPARAGLPENDSFKTVTRGSYLLVFTMVWGLQLFLRALF